MGGGGGGDRFVIENPRRGEGLRGREDVWEI